MVNLIQNNIQSILAACNRHHVKSLYLIGSATNELKFSENSDVDFLYRFRKDKISEDEYADNYFDLLFTLEKLLNRKVDLVPEDKLKNPYFIERINNTKIKLYES